MEDLVIRICFKSGSVSEERGTEFHINALFDDDKQGLIDYVMALEPKGGEIALWQHDGDTRWAELEY